MTRWLLACDAHCRILAVMRTDRSIAAMVLAMSAAAWVALIVSCGGDASKGISTSSHTGSGGAGSHTGSGGADAGAATCADLPCGATCPGGNCQCDGRGNTVFAADCSACQGKACGAACGECTACQCNSLGGCVPPGDPTSGCH
jgi:hypothetical protein